MLPTTAKISQGGRTRREQMGEEQKRSLDLYMAGIVRLFAAAVFLGYIVLCMIVPTKRYWQEWLPELRVDTSSTYFGSEGTNLLLFTSPVLLISILGCIYVHLKKHSEENRRKGKLWASFWKRPAIARGPLGIVSWTELVFLLMFLGLLTWYYSVFLSNSFSRINLEAETIKGEKVWKAKLESAGYHLGLLGNLCLAFLFFPVTRGSSILPLVGLTSESSIKYHIWLGHLAMVLFTLHGLLYFIYWTSTDSLSSMLEWAKTGVSNLAGELALLFGLILWAATLPRIRRKAFEIFFFSHQFYALFLLFFLLHVGVAFFSLVLPGVYLFMIDRFLRFLQSRDRVRLVSARLLPGETIELNFAKSLGLEYNALSNVFLNVPAVSRLQWHPFTVASNSNLEPDTLSIIIKKEGSWTHRLHQILVSRSPNGLECALEGPYGPVTNTFSRYDSLILISGGSGITPFIAVIREFIFRCAAGDGATPAIHLICAFKKSADLTMLSLLLPLSGSVSDISSLNLRVDAFVTRETEASAHSGAIQTIWFEPTSAGEPLSSVLSHVSWLFLSIIIAFSFGSFLLLLGIMDRYYIYPKDQNTNIVYSYTSKAFLNLLVISAAIVLTATVAFLWTKQRYAVDARQKQITDDGAERRPSRGKRLYSAQKELESLPQDCIVQLTNLHFGRRPSLKKILLEHEEENVGVLVSGPREMRRDVAGICASGLANNLHYEDRSFTW